MSDENARNRVKQVYGVAPEPQSEFVRSPEHILYGGAHENHSSIKKVLPC